MRGGGQKGVSKERREKKGREKERGEGRKEGAEGRKRVGEGGEMMEGR